MDDMEMFGPPLPNPVMDEAMALDTKVDALCKLAQHVENLKNSAARMRLIEAMDVVLGAMRPPAILRVFDNSTLQPTEEGDDA